VRLEPQRELDGDEVVVCVVLAFCIGNGLIFAAYRIVQWDRPTDQ
jgi:hypothetical protein